MFSVDQILSDHFPGFAEKPAFVSSTLSRLLRLILREKDFVAFSSEYPHLRGMDFVEQVLAYFDFDYQVRMSERAHIPSDGQVVIVANHPIGSLDGLALLKMVHEIRPDVKVVANNLLQKIQPLESMLLPVNNMQGATSRACIRAIHTFLQAGGALIIFPAGEVSRLGAKGVQDGPWNPGFLRMAEAAQAPVVPVFVDGKNSPFFYGLSVISRPLSTLWLVREMFKQQNRAISMRIGEPVHYGTYSNLPVAPKAVAKLFRKHLYRIGKGKSPLLKTEKAIALPENRQQLRTAIRAGILLGETRDGKKIWLHDYRPDSPVMREIARLREVSFRAVGEGCGKRRDNDRFDMYYQHMVLWDDDDMEVVGAYRWRATGTAGVADADVSKLYCSELFELQDGFGDVLCCGLELGRSFVQPRYWGKRSLDYLWSGIGAYLKTRPDIRYLYGPVSISQNYPPHAMAMLVCFYQTWFGSREKTALARLPYRIPADKYPSLQLLFPGESYLDEFRVLKEQLQQMGLAVPTLYKQYTELCEQGGVLFVDFNIDPAFANCVDGLVVVDLQRVKPAKLNRYMG
ncbi:MAG TPA: GNAT family N-acyltransferase [Pseudomonadales bacterium]|nr:GNAT family N-acyltransferase [Pseudomonadales bacterium]